MLSETTNMTDEQLKQIHLLMPDYVGLPGGIRELYNTVRVVATSTIADIILIRSHIAYHASLDAARRADIRPSRGHSYKVDKTTVVRISNHYDHRNGVEGYAEKEIA